MEKHEILYRLAQRLRANNTEPRSDLTVAGYARASAIYELATALEEVGREIRQVEEANRCSVEGCLEPNFGIVYDRVGGEKKVCKEHFLKSHED